MQRLREAEHELAKIEGDIIKYNKIGELWEAKCEQLETDLETTKKGVKHYKGLNSDSLEVTEELKEEVMFLQMQMRRHEQRAEFAEGIVDKLEQNCEKLNDQLFLENSKFMKMSEELENKSQNVVIQETYADDLVENNKTPIPENQDQVNRLLCG